MLKPSCYYQCMLSLYLSWCLNGINPPLWPHSSISLFLCLLLPVLSWFASYSTRCIASASFIQSGLLWVWIVSPKRYADVLTTDTCECDFIWTLGLSRCNQVKNRSLGWALIQCGWCPYKNNKHHMKTKTHREKKAIELWKQRVHDASPSHVPPRTDGKYQKLEGSRKD